MPKTTLFLFLSLLVSSLSQAQQIQNILDSLKKELTDAKEDTTKSLLLAELSYRLYLDLDSAYYTAKRGLEIAEKIQFDRGLAANYFSLGNYYGHIYDYQNAFEYLDKSLELQVKSGEVSKQARTYFLIGTLASRNEDYSKAIKYFKEGLKTSQGNNDSPMDEVLLLNNIGSTYIYIGKLDTANHYLQTGLQIARKMDSEYLEAIIHQSLGELNLASGDLEKAAFYFQKSIRLIKQEDPKLLLNNLLFLSEVFLKQNRLRQAESHALNAREFALSLSDMAGQQRSEEFLYKIFRQKGEFTLALSHFERSVSLKDSIYSFYKLKEVERLKSALDISQKELKIKSLEQENAKNQAALNLEKERVANQRFFTVSLLLLSLLITLVLWFIRKQNLFRKKYIYELQKKNNQIFDQNNEIRLLNETLEERVKERTESILNQKKKLEDYSFLNAHRLRGPVATLLGILHLIEIKSVNSDELPHMLSQIEEQVKQIDIVVKEINRAIE